MQTAITNGAVFDGTEFHLNRAVLVDKGQVVALVADDEIPAGYAIFDLKGNCLAPGYIDLQVNGGGGLLFNDAPTVETIKTIAQAHRKYGTTQLLPTLISDDIKVVIKAIAAVDQAIEQGVTSVLGIHIEGPFLNPLKKGIHNQDKFIALTDELVPVVSALNNGVTLITLAPECAPLETIGLLKAKDCIVFAGHTNATYEQCFAAENAGLDGYTHLFNAMTPLHSRAPGAVGAALSSDGACFGVIADGHHVHPASLKAAFKARPEGMFLVTDAMPSVGSEHTTFALGEEAISVENGRCQNDQGVLAGSHLTMESAVKNIQSYCQTDKKHALNMASLLPARVLGLDNNYGRIAPGYSASFVVLDAQDKVTATFVDGKPEL